MVQEAGKIIFDRGAMANLIEIERFDLEVLVVSIENHTSAITLQDESGPSGD